MPSFKIQKYSLKVIIRNKNMHILKYILNFPFVMLNCLELLSNFILKTLVEAEVKGDWTCVCSVYGVYNWVQSAGNNAQYSHSELYIHLKISFCLSISFSGNEY